MVWIKNGKVHKIITAMSKRNIQIVIRAHEKRGWRIVGEIKPYGYGLACLMVNEGPRRVQD